MDRATLAAEAFKQSDNNTDRAADILFDRLKSDPVLYAQYIDPLIREWCQQVIGSECVRKPRASIWTPAVNASSNARANTFKNSLLDFPLPGGKPLRHATKADLKAAIEIYTKQAKNMMSKAQWMQRIVDSMGNKRTVGSAFTDEALQQMLD